VINTNLPPILHRFQVKADYWSNLRYRLGSALTPPAGGIPANIPINFAFPETRWIVLPDAENRTIVMFIRLDKTPEYDGRTDRQTDRQNPFS